MARPSKPIGPLYAAAEARKLAASRGWQMRRDRNGYRRAVPSPAPREVLELPAIRVLVEAGVLVICAGGGGVPLVRLKDGELTGVEAVVDKDFTSALLAEELGADALLLLTDVEAVELDWNTPAAQPLGHASVAELRSLTLEEGSMGPKVEAGCRFVERTGRRAAIGALSQAAAILMGDAGTLIFP